MAKSAANTYSLEVSDKQREEIEALTEGVFKFDPDEPQPRRKWWAVAQMATGKAAMLEDGLYGDDEEDVSEQAEELRDIADLILNEFQPGDGKV